MGKISVIVPFHNEERWLDRCIRSVREQTYGDWELILVDDCSTDHSAAIARRWANLDARIRLLAHVENRGWSAARNFGIDQATGDYVMFLDGDDYLEPGAFEEGNRAMEQYGADYVIGGSTIEVFDPATGEVVSQTPGHVEEDFVFEMSDFARAGRFLWETSGLLFYCVWGKLFRMDIIRDHSLRFDLNIYVQEDFNFVMRYYYHVRRAVAVPQTFNIYCRPTDKDDIGEKPVVDQHNFNEVTLISILRLVYKFKLPEDFCTWLYHEVSEQYVRLTSKIFLDSTGLTEEERRHHVYAMADNFIFRFFCDKLAGADPLWTDMVPLRAADDFEGMYERMKEKVETDLLPPCL